MDQDIATAILHQGSKPVTGSGKSNRSANFIRLVTLAGIRLIILSNLLMSPSVQADYYWMRHPYDGFGPSTHFSSYAEVCELMVSLKQNDINYTCRYGQCRGKAILLPIPPGEGLNPGRTCMGGPSANANGNLVYACGGPRSLMTYFSTGKTTISWTSPPCTYGAIRYGSGCTSPRTLISATQGCGMPSENPKNPPRENCIGNPINPNIANKFADEVDYIKTGVSPLKFTRHYNSQTSYKFQATFGTLGSNNPIGKQWLHNYHAGISAFGSNRKLTNTDGQTFVFTPVSGIWKPDADIDYRLEEVLSGTTRTGWKVTTPNDSVETYSAIGDLLTVTDRTGISQTLSYSCSPVSATCPVATPTTIAPYAGLLIKVTDNFGNSLNFTYNSLGQIATMTDPAGNIYRYSYDGNGNLKTVIYPDGTPSDLTNNPRKTYLYGSDAGELVNTASVSQPHALTGIIDENGVRYATYRYDAQGKAISTEHAGGVENYSLHYALDGSHTVMTDPLGTIRTTRFTTVLGVVKATGSDQPAGSGCSASASNLSYDPNGNLASRTDFNGNKSCYA